MFIGWFHNSSLIFWWINFIYYINHVANCLFKCLEKKRNLITESAVWCNDLFTVLQTWGRYCSEEEKNCTFLFFSLILVCSYGTQVKLYPHLIHHLRLRSLVFLLFFFKVRKEVCATSSTMTNVPSILFFFRTQNISADVNYSLIDNYHHVGCCN